MKANLRSILTALFVLATVTGFAQAPNISYSSPHVYTSGIAISPLTPVNTGGAVVSRAPTTLASGLSLPFCVAADASGNVYIGSSNGGSITKIPAAGGSPVAVGSGFNDITGIAVDASGNIYVADFGSNQIEEVPAGGGSTIVLGTFGNSPVYLALDAANNIYFTSDDGLLEIPAGGGSPVHVGTGIVDPRALAIDGAGNIYVNDDGSIKKIAAGTGTTTNIYTASMNLFGLGSDFAGNLYLADPNTSALRVLPAGSGTPVVLVPGYAQLSDVTIGRDSNMYITDRSSGIVQEIKKGGYSTTRTSGYSVSPLLPPGLSLDVNTGTITGVPFAARAAANYTVTAFNTSGSNTANINLEVDVPAKPNISYASPLVYTFGVPVSPLVPANTGGSVGARAQVTLGAVSNQIRGIAIDASGNAFIAQNAANNVIEIPADGSGPFVFASGFNRPFGIATDAAGNVYVSDSNNSQIVKIPAGGGTAVPVITGITTPGALTINAAGTIFYIDGFHNVKKIIAGHTTASLISKGTSFITGIALDAAGNIYITDGDNNLVQEITAGSSNRVTLTRGGGNLTGIAVDAAGNVYYTDGLIGGVTEIPVDGSPKVVLGSVNGPQGLAADAAGNLYAVDFRKSSLEKIFLGGFTIAPGLPIGLTFDAATGTISGTPGRASTVTNYTVTAANVSGTGSATFSIVVNPLPAPHITYSGAQLYTVGLPISPLAPLNTGGQVSGRAQVTLESFFGQPGAVAIDSSNNVYTAVPNQDNITVLPADGSPVRIIGDLLESITIDAAGNIYGTTNGNINNVFKISASTGNFGSYKSGFNFPRGVTVDGAGNVYVANSGANLVQKIPSGGGSPVTLGSGFSNPVAVAVDAAGNVYVCDLGNRQVKMIPVGGGSVVTLATITQGASGIAIDRKGNIYLSITGASGAPPSIAKLLPDGSTQPLTLDFSSPAGFSFDKADNLYITDGGNKLLKEINFGGYTVSPALPAGLAIDQVTGVISGTPTVNTPATSYTITAKNFGGSSSTVLSLTTSTGLTNLTVSAGTLAPAFSSDVTTYADNVPNTVSSLSVTPAAILSSQTITVNGATVASGSPSAPIALNVGPNVITTVVSLPGGSTKTYTINVNRTGDAAAALSNLAISDGTLVPTFAGDRVTYQAYENNQVSSVTLTPTTIDPTSTVTINGNVVASGSASPSLPLALGQNTVSVVVKNSGGDVTYVYTVYITRNLSANARIAHLSVSDGNLSPSFSPDVFSYTDAVPDHVTFISLTPTLRDAGATVTVNDIPVQSGTPSPQIPLAFGANTITLVSSAQNGMVTYTYTVVVNRLPSTNANLTAIHITPHSGLVLGSGPADVNYTTTILGADSLVYVTPIAADPGATITVNGDPVLSGGTSLPIKLADTPIVIKTIVTAQDNVTTKSYYITVSGGTPFPPENTVYQPVGVAKTPETARLGDEITVHEGVSPNGDGQNDVFTIDNIKAYPQNSLKIMSRSGAMVFEAKGYDNSTKVFDGHSSKNGKLQQPGTYFYSLDYVVKGVTRHKTGYIVLKY